MPLNVTQGDYGRVIQHQAAAAPDVVKELIEHFDLEQATKGEIKHYPLDDASPLGSDLSPIVNTLSQAHWNSLRGYVIKVLEDKGLNEYNLSGVVGKIKYLPTACRFGVPSDGTFKPFIFSYANNQNGFEEIMSEMNFAIEVYEDAK